MHSHFRNYGITAAAVVVWCIAPTCISGQNQASAGHWEGDTLVVDATHFNDETWPAPIPSQGGSGYFHSDALHVVERITRKGGALHWEATVEDPNVLSKPWIMTPRTEVVTDTMIYEQPVCEERATETHCE